MTQPAEIPNAFAAPAAPIVHEPAPSLSATPGLTLVTGADGQVSQVKTEDLAQAQAAGMRPATEAEYFGQAHPTSTALGEAAFSAARGASFGLSDKAYIEGSRLIGGDKEAEDTRRILNLSKQIHPTVSLGGEIAGAVAPAFFGDEAGVGGAVDKGLSFWGRAGARALEAAPRAALEGTAIGLGQQFSEDTLANRKLSAEAYLSAGVKGGALGLFTGGVTAGAVGAAGDKLTQLFGRTATDGAEEAGTRIGESAGERGPVGKFLDREGDIATFKGATGAKTADLKRLGVDVEGIEGREAELGRVLRDQGLTGPLTSQAETGRRLTEKVEEIGKSLKPIYQGLDKAETAVKPSMSSIVTQFEEKVRTPRLERIEGEVEGAAAESFLKKMVARDGDHPSFEKLWGRRQELDDLLAKNYSAPKGMPRPPGEEDLRALKNLINQEIDTAATKADPALAEKLRTANQLYSDLATVKKINTSNVVRDALSNNKVSITDVIAASHGGPVGMGMAAANMVKRRFGDQLAGHVLNSASQLQFVQNAADRLDSLLSKGTRSFIAGEKGAVRAAKPVTSEEVRAIRDATRSPEAVNARIAEHLGDMPQAAPKLAQQVSTVASRAAAWAQYALPKEQAPVGPVFSSPKPRPLSDSQLVKARATIETLQDGSIVVDRLMQGRLTPEHVAALKYVHPETYAQIQQYLTTHATEVKPELSVQQQFQLGMLFGTPITEASLPENIRAFQASFSQGNQAPGPGGAGGVAAPKMSGGPVDIGGSRSLAQDRLEAGSK